MPKLTPNERLAKIDEAIKKEEAAIEASKERIKMLKADRKKAEQEQEQSFANEILKLMRSKNISMETVLDKLNAVEHPEPVTDSTEPAAASSSPNDTIKPEQQNQSYPYSGNTTL